MRSDATGKGQKNPSVYAGSIKIRKLLAASILLMLLASGFAQEVQMAFLVTQGYKIIVPSPLPGAVVGQAYALHLSMSPAPSRCMWTIVSGHLPPGLYMDRWSGWIYGTPTAIGSSRIVIQARPW